MSDPSCIYCGGEGYLCVLCDDPPGYCKCPHEDEEGRHLFHDVRRCPCYLAEGESL